MKQAPSTKKQIFCIKRQEKVVMHNTRPENLDIAKRCIDGEITVRAREAQAKKSTK